MTKRIHSFYLLIVSVLAFSCVKDKPNTVTPSHVDLSTSKKVYVINEGNYGSGNASFTVFDPQTNQSIEDLYISQNGFGVGDVAQSMTSINGNYYLVINNSKKIIVCDAQFKKIGQINGFNSPRYIQAITNQKAYVTDLYANAISIVNLNSRLITGSIPCHGITEKMVMIYNKVYVTNSERAYVYVINTTDDQLTDSIYVGIGASSLVIDKNDHLWVLASGKSGNPARLSKINTLSHQAEDYWEFSAPDSPWNLCLNGNKDTLYYLNGDIFRMAISESGLPAEPIVKKGTKNYYGLGIHPNNSGIYASDALDYSQHSTIYMYDRNGTQIHLFKAGINANGFYFE